MYEVRILISIPRGTEASNNYSMHTHAQKKPTEMTKNICRCLCVGVGGSKLYIHEASTTMGPQASSTESIHHITSSERGHCNQPIHLCPSPITATVPPPPADSKVPCFTIRANVCFSISRAVVPFNSVVLKLPRGRPRWVIIVVVFIIVA